MPFRHSPVRAAGPVIEIIATRAGMRIQHEQRRRLALQRTQQPDQHRVLHAIAEVAGMEGVAIVHARAAFQQCIAGTAWRVLREVLWAGSIWEPICCATSILG